MPSLPSVLLTVHLVGLALAVGSATAKVVLLFKCRADDAFVPVYIRVARILTRQIITGIVLLALSGVGWLLLGYPFTPLLIVKIVLFAGVVAIGPVIDNVAEPKFRALAPAPGEPASAAFATIRTRYLALEIIATLLFYAIVIIWVQR